MKTLLLTILTTLAIIFLPIQKVIAQNHPLLNSDHIPLMGLHHSATESADLKIPLYPKLKEMGLEGVMFGDVSQNMYDGFYGLNDQMKLIPWQVHYNVNYIDYFTSGVYTIWQAQDTETSPLKAALKYHSDIGERVPGELNTIRTRPFATRHNLITGPGYNQRIRYASDKNWINPPPLIDYIASFHIKLDTNAVFADPPQSTEGLDDTLCILKVIVKEIAHDTVQGFHFADSLIWKDTTILVNQFNYFGQWKKFDVLYNYQDLPENFKFAAGGTERVAVDNVYADYVEFYIEWMGIDYARLYFDTLLVSDIRGQRLFGSNELFRNQIKNQADNTGNGYFFEEPPTFATTIAGFYGQDEPGSIDNLEPIRKVGELMREQTNGARPLFISIAMNFDSTWGNSSFGVYGLSHNREFYNRAKPDGFLMQTHIYWDDNLGTVNDVGSQIWRIQTSYVANLKSLQNTAPTYSVLVQTGKWLPDVQLEPTPEQLRFSVYMALLYGAKGIFFDQVFVSNNDIGGIIDPFTTPPYYSPLYDEIKDNIYPRTSGWFGKTLNQIHQTVQYSNLSLPTGTYNYISSIGYNPGEGSHPANPIDLGFFKKDDEDYFMLLNRYYYSANPGDSLVIHINKSNSGYINWNLTNFIDSTLQTIVEEYDIKMSRVLGDCRLFKVYPVLKDGGSLVVSEATHPNDILLGDLTIENGATLTVNGTYNAKANITIKTGGKIEYGGNNSKIIFGSGNRLIVEGAAEIKGTSSSNKLTLQFPGTNGILIKAGSSLTMGYCNITGAYQGINTENGARSYVNISNCSFNTVNTSISLISNSTTEEELTSQIINCTITSTFTGINVSNYNQILIKENTLTGGGIFISNASAAYLQSNTITGGGSITTYGVFMSSSTGYVRGNIVSNCYNGIHLANSSPDVGGNIVLDNIRHGMFIGSGSIPNLVGYLQINPPLYFPLSGYNKIYENGFSTSSTGDNDGSEIYLSEANILLTNGCNQISDDRESTPNMNTQYLISGSLSNGGRLLGAVNNYWGTTTPTASRFNGLNVIYSPYYTVNCPLPEGGGGGQESFVFRTSTGLVVDTIYAAEGVPENITELESVYSEADKLYATGVIADAQPLYEQIVAGNYSAEEKLPAYNKLYAIGNLLGEDETYFNTLQNNFETISNNQTDTLIKKVYSQNAIKCDVSKGEYLTAISKFDNIIQQNPNGEEAVYAEIDILTTALNLDTTNSSLGKISNGKYLVKGSPDYLSKINDLISSKFGIPENEKEKIIPTEYSLHQNYPNPFNPSTTIKFDIPKDGLVQLEVFDILGRRIYTMVNEYKTAGSYEHQFDASSLASGVYIYKIQAGEFVSSKKMMLLK